MSWIQEDEDFGEFGEGDPWYGFSRRNSFPGSTWSEHEVAELEEPWVSSTFAVVYSSMTNYALKGTELKKYYFDTTAGYAIVHLQDRKGVEATFVPTDLDKWIHISCQDRH